MAFEEYVPEDTAPFRSEDFTDTCTYCGISMKEISGEVVDIVNLGFENGADLDVFLPKGFPENFNNASALGRFVKSMYNLGYKFMYDKQANQIAFNPSIEGAEMSFTKGEKAYTKDGEEKTFTWWECSAISGNGSTPATQAAQEAANAPDEEHVAKVEDLAMEVIDTQGGSASKRDIANAITASCASRAESKPLQAVRDVALQNLIDNSMISLEGGMYKVV